MSDLINRCFKPGSTGRWIISGFHHSPVRFAFALLGSLVYTRRLCGSFWPIKVRVAAGQGFHVSCASRRNVRIEGILSINSWLGSSSPSSLNIGAGSRFIVSGDFEIGPGVHILVAPGGSLKIGGRLDSSASGITCDSRIMVEQSVEIGYDCIVAWNVFISDSDWHDISGVKRNSPVIIGNKVWISHGASILKGAIIPSGCIIGAGSLVSSVIDSEKALVVGIPAVVKRTGVEWSR